MQIFRKSMPDVFDLAEHEIVGGRGLQPFFLEQLPDVDSELEQEMVHTEGSKNMFQISVYRARFKKGKRDRGRKK